MRFRHLPFIFAVALTSTLVVVESASAQPAPAGPSAADRDTARKLLDDGDAAATKGDKEGALKAYQAAHAIMNLPSTGIEVAKAQAALGQLIEARETALEVARMPVLPKEPAVFATARKDATDLAAALDPRIASLRVNLSGLAAGVVAEVRIDGTLMTAAAVGSPRRVNPGTHKITATAPGYVDASADAEAGEGASVDVPLEMKAEAVKVPKPKPPVKTSHRISVLLPIGLATTGVGLGVTLGAGVAALKSCRKGVGCPAAIVADVGLGVTIAGAALTTTGIVLTVTGPSTPQKTEAFRTRKSAEALELTTSLSAVPLMGGGFLSASGSFQ